MALSSRKMGIFNDTNQTEYVYRNSCEVQKVLKKFVWLMEH